MSSYDALIVGGGPAGLTAAVVLGRQRRRVLLVDADTPRNVNSSAIHMLPGREGMAPADFRARVAAEIDALETVTRVTGRVASVVAAAPGVAFTAQVEPLGADPIEVRRVLLATGVRDLPADIPGLAENFGRGVYHCPFCHGYEVSGHSIAVIAGGYFGATLAGYIRDRFSDNVTWFSHDGVVLAPDMQRFLDEVGVVHEPAPVAAVEPAASGMVVRTSDGEVKVDSVFHKADVVQQSTLIAALGLAMTPEGSVSVDGGQMTSVAGVYAAGDCARVDSAPGPSGFAATGSGDGQRAAVWLEQSLLREDVRLPAMQ
ncbi:NAD(P)/FAD-dependent oxidoreductase [Williamsia sp. CHRR-6]|uniref:NAD(P)/FAD-dependent oxidoreductase n=1 Tax=Williamsia sp. CHRR-6 TaxID=2835871 RepID=UPI001BD9A18B|nr:NAD(P)/FAD-dependent oxidoreductase [Williamsia sp. CHRR-6]MBT0565846.1 NAD(P)/FAD-dependent oxidoreductase [Williamsia sp. CHRR-6]